MNYSTFFPAQDIYDPDGWKPVNLPALLETIAYALSAGARPSSKLFRFVDIDEAKKLIIVRALLDKINPLAPSDKPADALE